MNIQGMTGMYYQSSMANLPNTTNYDALIFCLDFNLNSIWSTYYGGNVSDLGLSIETTGEDLLLVGWTSSYNSFPLYNPNNGEHFQGGLINGDEHGFISKFSAQIIIPYEINELLTLDNSILFYPNPSDGKLSIKIDNINDYIILHIYNSLGEMVKRVEISNGKSIQLDLSFLIEGFYSVTCQSEGAIVTKKIVIVK